MILGSHVSKGAGGFGPACAALLVLLSACATAPVATAPAPPRAVVAAIRPPAAPRNATWQFVTGAEACVARASDGSARFVASVEAARILFSIETNESSRFQRAAQAQTLSFTGPEGEWRLPVERGPSGALTTQLALDEPGVVRVLALIGGGSLAVERGGVNMRQLRLPPGGPQGRSWFECVRARLLA